MYRIGEVRFGLVRCPCGMVYVDPRPDDEALGQIYDDPSYYTDGYNLGVETENYFDRREELIAQYDRAVAEIEEETGIREGRFLELGSAGGFFLAAARGRGFEVAGIELSPPAIEYSRRELGLDVFAGYLEDAPYAPGSFDLALADNVLEHTLCPARSLAHLRELLRPGGYLVVIVPSYVNSFYFRAMLRLRALLPRRLLGRHLLRILKFDEGDAGYPYHILEFDRATLLRLVRQAGFEVVSVQGSVPLPAHLFKRDDLSAGERFLRGVFRFLDSGMRRGLLPAARLRFLLRRPPDPPPTGGAG
jgi:SAM-dependent methyltransferase